MASVVEDTKLIINNLFSPQNIIWWKKSLDSSEVAVLAPSTSQQLIDRM